MLPIKLCEEYKIILWIKSCTDKIFQNQHQYLQLLSTPGRVELLQLRKTLYGFAMKLVTYPGVQFDTLCYSTSRLYNLNTSSEWFYFWSYCSLHRSLERWNCLGGLGAIFRLFITPPCFSCCCCIGYLAFLGPTPSFHMARREFATMGKRHTRDHHTVKKTTTKKTKNNNNNKKTTKHQQQQKLVEFNVSFWTVRLQRFRALVYCLVRNIYEWNHVRMTPVK